MNFKNFFLLLKKLIKRRDLLWDTLYDYYRFETNSSVSAKINKVILEKIILRQYHSIEKGLSLPDTRKGFGKKKIFEVLDSCELYYAHYQVSNVVIAALSAIREYIDFHDNDITLIKDVVREFEKWEDRIPELKTSLGGARNIDRTDIQEAINIDFELFLKNRHSIRDFDSTNLQLETIYRALELARHTPSVCNRQGWTVHVYTDNDLVQKALDCQQGNRAFRQTIKGVILICGDLRAYILKEKNQCFVDGGLYAMNLMLSLHSQGLGSCPLSTAYTRKEDKEIRKVLRIGSHETPIMMLAIGNLKDKFKIAKSFKLDFNHYTFFNK